MGSATSELYGSGYVVELASKERVGWSSRDQPTLRTLVGVALSRKRQAKLMSILPFRADEGLEAQAQGRRLNVLAAKALVVKDYSRKSWLYEIQNDWKQEHLAIPAIRLMGPEVPDFNELKVALGTPFIVKGDFSVSGAECFTVDSAPSLKASLSSCGAGSITAWGFIKGFTLNYHFIIDEEASVIFPPSMQIAARGGALRYGGNSFPAAEEVSLRTRYRIAEGVRALSERLRMGGYRGIGGADVIVDERSRGWLVDLNPRFQGSSLLLARGLGSSMGLSLACLQRQALMGSLGLGMRRRLENLIQAATTWGEQLFLHAKSPCRLKSAISDGIYFCDMTWVNRTEPAERLRSDEFLVLDLPAPGVTIAEGSVVARFLNDTPGGMDLTRFAESFKSRYFIDTPGVKA